MQLITNFQNLSFIDALKAFFQGLEVPVNHIADEPVPLPNLLGDLHHPENEFQQLLQEVYVVGIVNDAIFNNQREMGSLAELQAIEGDYDGLMVLGAKVQRHDGRMPSRTQLANLTRLLNRAFPHMPVVVVFMYDQHLAFANAERVKYSQAWREGEKVGKVSLLRDINIAQLHSGHERILLDLKLPKGKNKVNSFAELYSYWQEVFSVSVLNKKFYQELSNWYFWAVKHVTFPNMPTAEIAHEKGAKLEDLIQEHNATNVIRLLTRLLFTWFIKEKKLIPEALFDLDALQENILNEIAPFHEEGIFKQDNQDSVYYKAILQNLFFATLNCPIKPDGLDKRFRDFRRDKNYGDDFGNDWLYRYKKYFRNPDKFLNLMNEVVPFLNGGLFECLDEKLKKVYVDGFSDHMAKGEYLIVPDYLFFGIEEHVDLSAEYGASNKGAKQAAVKGLINILKSYKFTITENTPIEEDVALDPELLGKVFENLLASYNPETKTTARKQTGSFYTPREIVNYMVDESLIAFLKNKIMNEKASFVEFGKVQTNLFGNEGVRGQQSLHLDTAGSELKDDEERLDALLHELVSYDPVNPLENYPNTAKIILRHLSECKILDPACGSGAFPMGVLQKMVHILHKLDPDNTVWKEVQRARIQKELDDVLDIEDKAERQARMNEINEAFDQGMNDPDYARKLYLIENCIYGVDIQPIATQISKLRFFISLVVEQKVRTDKTNFGIRPLPNLETKFVTANTLIGIEKPKAQLSLLDTPELKKLETELKTIRHKLFSARTKDTKLKYRKLDEELRMAIAQELKDSAWPAETADLLASWDPYDQNASSPFFDPEWMFDIKNGFDVVIGNPPYVLLQERIKEKVDIVWIRNSYKVASYKVDLYHLFYEKGIELLSEDGALTFITPTNFLLNNYTVDLRKLLLESKLSKILLIQNSVFEASVDTSVFIINKGDMTNSIHFNNAEIRLDKLMMTFRATIERSVYLNGDYIINPEFDPITLSLITKIAQGDFLGNLATVNFGMQLRNRKLFPSDVLQNPNEMDLTEFHKKCYTGRDIKEFDVHYENRYCYFNREAQSGGCWDESAQFANPKVLVPQVGRFPVAGMDKKGYAVLNTAFMIIPKSKNPIYNLLAIINSSVVRYYWGKKFYDQRQTFPKIKGTYLKEIPVPKNYDQVLISTIAKILSSTKEPGNQTIRTVLDGAVSELYFPEHMKERQIDVMELVERDMNQALKGRDFENLSDGEKEKVIEQLHATWTDPNNEVVKRMGQFREKSPEILGVILDS